MGRKGKNSSLEQRQLIVRHYAKGRNYAEIAEMLNIPKSTVGDIVRRYKNEGRIILKQQKGQPKKLTEGDERLIARKIKKNPRLSAPKIASEVFEELGKAVHPQTIRRTLKRQGFNGRVARKKPLINERNRKKRIQFAKEYIRKDSSFWNDVIFADESKYNVFGSDGRTMVWRRCNEELKPSNITPTVKHGGGHVMVWGCISANGVGELVFINENMNKEMYLDILKKNLKKSAENLGILPTFKFYQDNDPKHKSYLVREWLLYNCPKVIETPPQSPDLNPIENIWDALDRRIRKTSITSLADLKIRLKQEWTEIGQDYCQKIVQNMPNRLHHVLKQKGYPTKY